jgi:hypothetical protein
MIMAHYGRYAAAAPLCDTDTARSVSTSLVCAWFDARPSCCDQKQRRRRVAAAGNWRSLRVAGVSVIWPVPTHPITEAIGLNATGTCPSSKQTPLARLESDERANGETDYTDRAALRTYSSSRHARCSQ